MAPHSRRPGPIYGTPKPADPPYVSQTARLFARLRANRSVVSDPRPLPTIIKTILSSRTSKKTRTNKVVLEDDVVMGDASSYSTVSISAIPSKDIIPAPTAVLNGKRASENARGRPYTSSRPARNRSASPQETDPSTREREYRQEYRMRHRRSRPAGKVPIRNWSGYKPPKEKDVYQKGDTYADMMQKCRIWDLEQESIRANRVQKLNAQVALFGVIDDMEVDELESQDEAQPPMALQELGVHVARIKAERAEREAKHVAILAGTVTPGIGLNTITLPSTLSATSQLTTSGNVAAHEVTTPVEGEVNMTGSEEDFDIILDDVAGVWGKFKDSGIYVHDDDVTAAPVTTTQPENEVEIAKLIAEGHALVQTNATTNSNDDCVQGHPDDDEGFVSDDSADNASDDDSFGDESQNKGVASSDLNSSNDDLPEPPADSVQICEKGKGKQRKAVVYKSDIGYRSRLPSPEAEFTGMIGFKQPSVQYDSDEASDASDDIDVPDKEDVEVQTAIFNSLRSTAEGAGAQAPDESTSKQAEQMNRDKYSVHDDEHPDFRAARLLSFHFPFENPVGRSSGPAVTSSPEIAHDAEHSLQQGLVRNSASQTNSHGISAGNQQSTEVAATEDVELPEQGLEPHSLAYELGLLRADEIVAKYNLTNLSKLECVALIKNFLKKNYKLLNEYKDFKSAFAGADSRIEFSGAIKYLDVLFEIFRPEIVQEDKKKLRPKLYEIEKLMINNEGENGERALLGEETTLMGEKRHLLEEENPEVENSKEEKLKVIEKLWDEFNARHLKIVSSNRLRSDLIASTNLSVPMFQELVLAAHSFMVYPIHDHIEELPVEEMRSSLHRIYNTIKLNVFRLMWPADDSAKPMRELSGIYEDDIKLPSDEIMPPDAAQDGLRGMSVGDLCVLPARKMSGKEYDSEQQRTYMSCLDPNTEWKLSFPPRNWIIWPQRISPGPKEESPLIRKKKKILAPKKKAANPSKASDGQGKEGTGDPSIKQAAEEADRENIPLAELSATQLLEVMEQHLAHSVTLRNAMDAVQVNLDRLAQNASHSVPNSDLDWDSGDDVVYVTIPEEDYEFGSDSSSDSSSDSDLEFESEIEQLATKKEKRNPRNRQSYIEEQLWRRDHAIGVFRHIRAKIQEWLEIDRRHEDLDNIESLLARIDDDEEQLLRVQQHAPLTSAWLVGFKRLCPRVNKPEGCPYADSRCVLDHRHKGTVCTKGAACQFGKECVYEQATGHSVQAPSTKPKADLISTKTRLDIAAGKHDKVPCMLVNKVGGCPGQKLGICTHFHYHDGKVCTSWLQGNCDRGSGCAWLHRQPDNSAPQRQAAPRNQSADQQLSAQQQQSVPQSTFLNTKQDLKLRIDEVVPETRWLYACKFVNKPSGCKNANCTYNHTLRDVPCPKNDGTEGCAWGNECRLAHSDQRKRKSVQEQALADIAAEGSLKRKFQGEMFPIDTKRVQVEQLLSNTPTGPKGHGQQQAQQTYSPQYSPQYQPIQSAGHGQPSTLQWSQQLLSSSYQPYYVSHYQPAQRPQPPANAPRGPRALNQLRPAVRPDVQPDEALQSPAAGHHHQQQTSQQSLASVQGPNGLRIMGAATRMQQARAGPSNQQQSFSAPQPPIPQFDGGQKRTHDDYNSDVNMDGDDEGPESPPKRTKRHGKKNGNNNRGRGGGRGRGSHGVGHGVVRT